MNPIQANSMHGQFSIDCDIMDESRGSDKMRFT